MACCPYTNNRERDEKYATVVTIEYGDRGAKIYIVGNGRKQEVGTFVSYL
jgi:hypothetical protein